MSKETIEGLLHQSETLHEQLISLNESLEKQVKLNKVLERDVHLLEGRCQSLERVLFSMNSIEGSAVRLQGLIEKLQSKP